MRQIECFYFHFIEECNLCFVAHPSEFANDEDARNFGFIKNNFYNLYIYHCFDSRNQPGGSHIKKRISHNKLSILNSIKRNIFKSYADLEKEAESFFKELCSFSIDLETIKRGNFLEKKDDFIFESNGDNTYTCAISQDEFELFNITSNSSYKFAEIHVYDFFNIAFNLIANGKNVVMQGYEAKEYYAGVKRTERLLRAKLKITPKKIYYTAIRDIDSKLRYHDYFLLCKKTLCYVKDDQINNDTNLLKHFEPYLHLQGGFIFELSVIEEKELFEYDFISNQDLVKEDDMKLLFDLIVRKIWLSDYNELRFSTRRFSNSTYRDQKNDEDFINHIKNTPGPFASSQQLAICEEPITEGDLSICDINQSGQVSIAEKYREEIYLSDNTRAIAILWSLILTISILLFSFIL